VNEEVRDAPPAEEQIVPGTLLAWSLVAANVGMFLATQLLSARGSRTALIVLGAKVTPLIDQGEYWRLFTAMFLHAGVPHLMFNMLAILTFGRMAEVIFGHTRFLVIYVVAGLAASTASYAFTRGLSVGASGAIFGIAAAVVVFYARNRRVAGDAGRSQIMGYSALLGINLVLGFISPGIDNWGHLGGMVAGAALAWALAPRLIREQPTEEGPSSVRAIPSPAVDWLAVPAALAAIAALVLAIQGSH
jgi:membrane associated rhomboid family serine protease